MRTHKILIADDSLIEGARARAVLEQLPGVQIRVVEDGASAVREAKNSRFDLLLVDYEMPGLNGLQVLRVLRGTWSRVELPILMLTVRDDVHTKADSLRQGANDYVTKPVEPEELLARVKAHLDLRAAVEANLAAREQILEARKLEIIGRLSAGLAHELNTPAQYTADNVVFLQRALSRAVELLDWTRQQAARLEPDQHPWAREFSELWNDKQLSYLLGEAPKALDESLNGVMRMARIVKELEEFAGAPLEAPGPTDVNRALENTSFVSRQLWASAAQLTFRLEPGLPEVVCDTSALKQAFLNLLVALVECLDRAAAAPGQLAQIEIETRRGAGEIQVLFHCKGEALGAAAAALLEGLCPGDEQVPIDPSHPLALAHSVVVRQHRGRIELDAEPGRGVTFRVRVPMAIPASAPPRASASVP